MTEAAHSPSTFSAEVILQAHAILTALIREELVTLEPHSPVLHWLLERHLVEEVLGDTGLELEITQRGREAILGRRATVQFH